MFKCIIVLEQEHDGLHPAGSTCLGVRGSPTSSFGRSESGQNLCPFDGGSDRRRVNFLWGDAKPVCAIYLVKHKP